MAEEHRCQAQENHQLCANNYGFFGSPATLNMCSKCYRDQHLKEDQSSSTSVKSLTASSSSSSLTSFQLSSPAVSLPAPTVDYRSPVVSAVVDAPLTSDVPNPEVGSSNKPNRCSSCRKRVGLTGFRCRCGITFCSTHRYPEQHACTFDFKAVGREAIARANPLIKGEKLQKI